MFCSACGNKVSATARFCSTCGHALEEGVPRAVGVAEEPPPLPPSAPPPHRSLSPSVAAVQPVPTKSYGFPWIGFAAFVLGAVMWTSASSGDDIGPSKFGYMLGGALVAFAVGGAVSGLLALIPSARRKLKGRWLSITFWTGAVLFVLLTANQQAMNP